MPISANCSGSSLARRRLQSAGTSRRLARSPAAPKMTRTQGAGGFACAAISAVPFGLVMAAEFVSHPRQQLVGETVLLARREADVENRGQRVEQHSLLDRRYDRPATVAECLD